MKKSNSNDKRKSPTGIRSSALLGVDPEVRHLLFLTTPSGRWWAFRRNLKDAKRKLVNAGHWITMGIFQGVFMRRGPIALQYLSERKQNELPK